MQARDGNALKTSAKLKKQHYQSFYLPTDAKESCLKRILKFTLKQLLRVLV
jgi:hypothetical protein